MTYAKLLAAIEEAKKREEEYNDACNEFYDAGNASAEHRDNLQAKIYEKERLLNEEIQ